MVLRIRINLVILPCLMLALASAAGATSFKDFNGLSYLPPEAEITHELGIGWSRQDFQWPAIEPERGKWNWDKTDEIVRRAQSQGAEILPMVGYTAPWAASIAGKATSAPKRVEDWEDFVEHVVARYSGAPFNLRYFQVWNEPTVHSGFWLGQSNEEFIDKIHLPAAKIIRRHNCYVVFGGWPAAGNTISDFEKVLNYHDAWKWTDFLDLHYRSLDAWSYLFDQWVRSGKCKGVWQSEIGFTEIPDFLPNTYLRALSWLLQHGQNHPDQARFFWFASWGNGPNAEKCLLKPSPNNGNVLTQHGTYLKVMNDMLGQGSLVAFTRFKTQPPLALSFKAESSAMGFGVGDNRTVIAFLLDRNTYRAVPSIAVDVPLQYQPQQVQLVTASGQRRVPPSTFGSGHLHVKLPVQDITGDCDRCSFVTGYLVVESAK